MSIKLPESVPIPQAGLLELLSGGIGQGISSAIDTQNKLKQTLSLQDRKFQQQSLLEQIKQENNQKTAQQKASQNFGTNFNKAALNIGIDLKKYGADPEKLNLINRIGSQRIAAGEDSDQVVQDLLGELDPRLKAQQEKLSQGGDLYGMLQGYNQPEEQNKTTFFDVERAKHGPTNESKRTLIGDIKRLDSYMKEVEEKQSQLSLMDKAKATAMIGQNIASGLSFGIVPAKELPEKYQHLQAASNFLKGVSEYVPLGGLLSAGKSLSVKGMQKVFPNLVKTAKVVGVFGGAAGGTLADVVSKTTETKNLPSAEEVAKDYAKWLAFETAFVSLGSVSKLDKNTVDKFVEATGATKTEASEYLKAKITPIPEEGPLKETTQKAKVIEKQTEKAPIGETQLREQEKTGTKTVQQLAKEPVEEIFKPEKEVKSKPETIAKEAARIATLEEEIVPLKSELKQTGSEIADLELQKRNAETKEARALVQEKLDRATYLRSEISDKIKGLEFERKYGTLPKTHAEIAEDIDASMKNIKEDIKNPKEISAEKIQKDLAAHEKAINKANEILRRGKFLGEAEADYYVKLKQQYADAYKDIIDQNERMIDELANKKTKIARKLHDDLEKMNKILSERLKRSNADILIQKNKRAIQKLTKGARGSFYKKELSKLREDVEALKQNLFKQNVVKNQLETKTEQAFKEAPKETHRMFTEEEASAEAKNAGTTLQDIKKDAKKTIEEIQNPKSTPVEQAKTLNDYLQRAKGKKLFGSAIYALNYFIKMVTGKGLPQRALKHTLGKLGQKVVTSVPVYAGGIAWIIKEINHATDAYRTKKLKEMNSIIEKKRYIDSLRKSGLSTRRINKIMKTAKP